MATNFLSQNLHHPMGWNLGFWCFSLPLQVTSVHAPCDSIQSWSICMHFSKQSMGVWIHNWSSLFNMWFILCSIWCALCSKYCWNLCLWWNITSSILHDYRRRCGMKLRFNNFTCARDGNEHATNNLLQLIRLQTTTTLLSCKRMKRTWAWRMIACNNFPYSFFECVGNQ